MDIFFEPQKGLPFTIEVGYFDTVLEIKEKVQKYQGIPVNKQTLVFNGQVLEDDRDIEYCELLHNSHVQLLIALDNDNEPQVKIEDSSPSNKIQLSIKTPSSKVLVPLKMDLGSTGVATTGTKKLKLMVLPKCGTKKIPIEVNASDNVGELRKELQKLNQRLHFHLPPEGYFFIYKQNVMDDDRSFRWHHVCQGDTIEIFNGSVTGGS
ncbi:ubiquitin domain-containing protein 7SL RNA2 isoform X2 [Manihot esculenta]|uniref:ubiquitin domain-containing protein 7SL RNA2 isoform X2 n=1 Tax=Manihot esculenta TaxID=3983 RepID=UPI001CC77B5C|nr:ubiquitin domain-containing protein 7SL RNA2 isoform X2 [Manihot esculenta]